MRPLLTPQQTAAKLHCHVQTVFRHIREGRLDSFQLVPGGRRYIPEDNVEALIDQKIEEASKR